MDEVYFMFVQVCCALIVSSMAVVVLTRYAVLTIS